MTKKIFCMDSETAECVYTFLSNAESLSEFLSNGMLSILDIQANQISDCEKQGFALCMAAIKDNVKSAYTLLEAATERAYHE